jgi:hypothetical protein
MAQLSSGTLAEAASQNTRIGCICIETESQRKAFIVFGCTELRHDRWRNMGGLVGAAASHGRKKACRTILLAGPSLKQQRHEHDPQSDRCWIWQAKTKTDVGFGKQRQRQRLEHDASTHRAQPSRAFSAGGGTVMCQVVSSWPGLRESQALASCAQCNERVPSCLSQTKEQSARSECSCCCCCCC